jgi:hypothetical protein
LKFSENNSFGAMSKDNGQLDGAKADTLTPWNTPGQLLLKALQHSEQTRKERVSGTIAAKMREARDKLPSLQPKHPVKSDQAIFGDTEHISAEVQSLPADVKGNKAGNLHYAALSWD